MARNFLAFPFAPYQGGFSSRAFNTSRAKGTMITASVRWSDYTNTPGVFSVTTSLQAAGPNLVPAQWQPQSVYIDNEGVDFPVYVSFQDTQFVVSCPANSAGWYAIYTNGRQALISGIGIVANSLTTNQLTRLFFTDVPMTPYLDQEVQSAVSLWLASNAFPRFSINNANYNAPALGDQPTSATLNCAGPGTAVIALSAVGPGVFYYLTALSANVVRIGAGVSNVTDVRLGSPSLSSAIWTWQWFSTAGAQDNGPVFCDSGFNLKLDASIQYTLQQISGPVSNDRFRVNITYTLANG